jgi:hypothetical protein
VISSEKLLRQEVMFGIISESEKLFMVITVAIILIKKKKKTVAIINIITSQTSDGVASLASLCHPESVV